MKPIILILDDQALYGQALQRALRGNYEVRLATAQREAMERIEGVSIALVDIRLNEQELDNREGLSFIQWLRDHDKRVQIIAMTALEDEELSEEARRIGANYFLRKPIVVSKLRDLLAGISPSS